MKHWFTSDYHLGHYNIISYCGRPFSSLEEMNETIIKNHNERVDKDDMVFFLGDFCFRNSPGGKDGEGSTVKAVDYINRLNGNMVFIKGNHDRNNSLKTTLISSVIFMGGKKIFLCHRPDDIDPSFPICFVGHIHQHWKYKKMNNPYFISPKTITLVNVGVDVWNYRPRTFNELMSGMLKWEKNISEGDIEDSKDVFEEVEELRTQKEK